MWLAAIALSCGSARAAAPNPAPQAVQGGYFNQQMFELSGTCAMEVAPDKAFILGGVSSGGLKPVDTGDQLDKQLESIRAYIDQNHGKLELLERVRTLKNPQQQPGREDNEPPFQVVQRLQAEFPANAPMDAILQKLIELGLDRFGDNVLNNFNRREAVIRYRVSDFDARMHDLQQRCTADAWKQWCASPQAASAPSACETDKPPADLDEQSFNVHSEETLMRPEGNTAPWQFSYNRMQRSMPPPDLLGNVTVHLDGTILLMYRMEPKEAKP
jgi:hypothetical protein